MTTRDAEWLHDVFDAVDLVFFGERLHHDGVTVRWSRWRKTKEVTRLGCYWSDKKLIEVSPLLRLEWVPLHVVVSLVFHEGLHHVLGGGRAPHEHSDAFRIAEQRDPNFALSESWLCDHIERLTSAVPPGKETA